MQIDLEAAARCALFCGIAPEELERMLDCLAAVRRSYAPGAAVFEAGEPVSQIGVVLKGKVQIVREEYDGNRTIVTELGAGGLFGEAYACAGEALPVTVLAVEESSVLLLDYRRVAAVCPSACPFHTRLVGNMLAVLAEKNRLLNRRLGHLSKRSTREKLLSYLRETASLCGSAAFSIPFDRQGLADYLCVERSAMSAVLSRLRREGLVQYRRNRFWLGEASGGPPGNGSARTGLGQDAHGKRGD